MKASGTIEYNSLSWVKSQLDAVINDAQSSLSEYIEHNDDEGLMHDCIEGLRLVYGTLQMVEIFGAAMLAEEMENTARAILEGQVENREDAYDVLMRALLQLPDYLEGLQAGRKDTPMALLPLMNDMRAVCKQSLLSENVLFFPDMDAAEIEEQEIEAPVIEPGKLKGQAKRLRMHFQLGLLDLLKNDKKHAGIKRMLAVIGALHKASAEQSVRRYWSVIAALLEGLGDDGIDAGVSVKMLLGHADRQIKLVIDCGEEDFATRYSQELLKNALYYIAHSESSGERISRVREIYNLNELLSSTQEQAESTVGGLNAELFATVSQGIKEDLSQVKDALELFIHSSDRNVAELAPLTEQLVKIGDTYGMLGLGEARQKVLEQKDSIQGITEQNTEVDEELVFTIAGELLSAEADLDNYVAQRTGAPDLADDEDRVVPAAEYREVLTATLGQGLQNFTDAKDAIVSFVSGHAQQESLQTVLNLLEETRGVSMMLSMAQVETMLAKLKHYVKVALLDNGHQPDVQEQDKIADVVTSIEYFFEAMLDGRPGVEEGLRTGENALSSLSEVCERLASSAATPASNETADQQVEVEVEVEVEPEATSAETTAHEADIVEFKQPVRESEPEKAEPEIQTPEPAEESLGSEYDDFDILGDDADAEILEIFVEEAQEVLAELSTNLPLWKSNTSDEQALSVVRRCFHTLKGSGRLIGAQLIGEFAWKFENMLNRVIDKKIEADTRVFGALEDAVAVLPQLIEQLQGNREPIARVPRLMATAHALAEGKPPPAANEDTVKKKLNNLPEGAETGDFAEHPVSATASDQADDDPGTAATAVEQSLTVANAALDQAERAADQEFSVEDTEPAADEPDAGWPDLDEFEAEQPGSDTTAELLEAGDDGVHAARPPAESVDAVELNQDDGLQFDDSALADGWAFEIDEQQAQAAKTDSNEIAAGMDPVLFQIYYDESIGHLQLVNELLTAHKENAQPLTASKDLVRAFHTLYGSARTAEIDQIAELCGAVEKYIKIRQEGRDLSIDDAVVQLFEEVAQTVRSMLEQIKSGQMPAADKALAERINRAVQIELQHQLQHSSRESGVQSEPEVQQDHDQAADASAVEVFESAAAEAVDLEPPADDAEMPVEASVEEPFVEPVAELPVRTTAEIAYGDIDSDLIDIFIEEADELIENCEELLQKLTGNPDDEESTHQLQRYMHTLKGGARMAELAPVGDLTHLLESLVIKVADKQVEANRLLFDTLNASVDRLAEMLKNVKDRAPVDTASDIIAQVEALMSGRVLEKRSIERYDLELDDLKEPAANDQVGSKEAPPGVIERPKSDQPGPNLGRRATDKIDRPQWGERATDTNYRDAQDQIRVRADLLNELVNSAGEVNIYHARMGKQMSDIGFNLNELESTVVRLKQQLRNLEIETEIQIRSSFEKESNQYDEDFDPLEMDRYSTMQQLSRSLTETAGDVESIREILSEIVRDSETLLLQESRVSTELQEGLMRTRMVRFGGLSTRLRRIIRQTARELGKEVELEIIGESNELDRTILDRIVAPLEHMLRNAVAHGIEAPDKRIAAGKPEIGKITIGVDRQGGDIMMVVKDDGSGINAGAIRMKAVQQGLLDADSKVSDREVLQLILKSGFSTAEKVSQVAGRGVGMDVVDAELKQLGGVLEIDTFPGKGTEFTIRLPLTLAINQALLVSAAEDIYAIALASIEGVVRVTGAELQRFYESDQQRYSFNGVEYELKHLGQLLTGHRPDYSEYYGLFPVLLAQVGNYHYALHVDELVGRREVVVKPVGHQLGSVRGVTGATILADGRVVLIIELAALVVTENLIRDAEEVEAEVEAVAEQKSEERTIMVVDDSITIRKVTARMLERNGITVLLAKDGIDATNQLLDTKPDLMLLDIEMPRMDGFELASYIRNDERLKDLPIIMITSRTGEKHKERAMEIGVNEYLGKPYQEEELLKNINNILQA